MTSDEIIKEVNEALKEFGLYSWDDKGPNEVLDVASIAKRLAPLPAKDVGYTLGAVLKTEKIPDGRGEDLIDILIEELHEANGEAYADEVSKLSGFWAIDEERAKNCKPVQVKSISGADLIKKLGG